MRDYENLKSDIKSCAVSTSLYLRKESVYIQRRMERKLQQQYDQVSSISTDLLHDMEHELEPLLTKSKRMGALKNNSDVSIESALGHLRKDERLETVHKFFYQKFGKVDECNTEGIASYLQHLPKLDDKSYAMHNSEFSDTEFDLAIKKLPRKRSPGPDGLTAEFYIAFRHHYSKIMTWLANESICTGTLPPSVSTGVVSLIYKKGDPAELSNWRPITLCNVDYKIISSVIKNRIICHLSKLVGPHQSCNIRGRSIVDNLVFFRDLFSGSFNGAILSLDQEAAFDRVNSEFMITVLHQYKFPDKIIKCLRVLHKNSKIMVKVGGALTRFIPVNRGVKQGDPVSSLLFVLCFEAFLSRVKTSLNTSLSVAIDNPVTVAAYADDCQIILRNPDEFEAVESELERYCQYSGGKLNRLKSKCLLLGSWVCNSPAINFPTTTTGLEILGIHFGSPSYMTLNWDVLLQKFTAKLGFLGDKMKQSGIISKAFIISTYMIPMMWYKLQVLDPPDSFIDAVTEQCLLFL